MCIDTHSHLYGEEFATDIEEVLERARDAGIGKIFLPNINAASIEPMLSLAGKHPGFLYPMIGLHPEDLGDNWREVLAAMEQRLKEPGHPYIGVGEVGLDYYWDRSQYAEQQEALAIQVEWAYRYHLPLMIHCRSAQRELVEVLKAQIRKLATPEDPPLRGVFHCFSGSEEQARELLTFEGFKLGIGGVVTFKNCRLPEVLRKAVPLQRLVLETDAPYLAPVPYRGKRNESAYVTAVAKKLSAIYGVEVAQVYEITGKNALETFPRAL
ncbi:MAG: TatD family hydrolase [Bacteroidales bacterium]|nr:TatD family hydrolase [Bacteroidales bacterium]